LREKQKMTHQNTVDINKSDAWEWKNDFHSLRSRKW
jgi:hypothetical protein